MKTDVELTATAVVNQRRAAEIWIREFRKNQDEASIRCLMFALGRVSGAFELCRWACIEANAALPEELKKIQDECDQIYEEASSIALLAIKN